MSLKAADTLWEIGILTQRFRLCSLTEAMWATIELYQDFRVEEA